MLERTTPLAPNEAYEELRKILLREKCKIVEDDAPKSLVVEQEKFFKKNIRFNFISEESGTRIVSDTSLTSGSVALAILSPIISIVFTVFGWWMVADMRAYIEGLRSSLGGRFLELLGYTSYRQALSIIKVVELLVFVMGMLIIFEVISIIYYYVKRETVTEKLLSLLPRRVPAMP
jgi:hypothetical protein